MIISRWAPWFRQQYGGTLPSTYLSFDTETTGFSHTNDLILQWGHVLVRGGVVVNRLSMYINWYDSNFSKDEVDFKVESVARHMQDAGHAWNITPALLKTKGVHPDKALEFLHQYLTVLNNEDVMFVGHNIIMYDTKILCAHFKQDIDKTFVFPENRLLDTSFIEKATQLSANVNSLPRAGETLAGYFRRVSGIRATGTRFKLGDLVVKYGLDKLPGVDAELLKLHGADTDAYLAHLVFEEYRRQVSAALAAVPTPAVGIKTTDEPAIRSPVRSPARTPPPPATPRPKAFVPNYQPDPVAAVMRQELKEKIDEYYDGPKKPVAQSSPNFRKQRVR